MGETTLNFKNSTPAENGLHCLVEIRGDIGALIRVAKSDLDGETIEAAAAVIREAVANAINLELGSLLTETVEDMVHTSERVRARVGNSVTVLAKAT